MGSWSDNQRDKYIKQAISGDIQAQIYMGNAYITGEFGSKDEGEATYWLEKAEDQGSQVASFRLAFYQVHKSKREGLHRLQRLDEQGFAAAIYELGNCYYRGVFFERDAEKGFAAWERAAAKNHLLAKMKINKHRQAESGLLLKPVYFAMAAYFALLAMYIIIKRPDDPMVLGHLQ